MIAKSHIVAIGQRRRGEDGFLLCAELTTEVGVIEHHGAASETISVAFNSSCSSPAYAADDGLQTVLHAAAGHKEGVLAAKDMTLLSDFAAIGTQRHRRMVSGIDTVAQRVLDGQIL